MQDVTVNCGCGRRMNVDTLRGRGAFRCGCGVRVRVEIPKLKRLCVGTMDDGSQCIYVVVPGAGQYGLALCGRHLSRHEDYLTWQKKLEEAEAKDLDAIRAHSVDERTRQERSLDLARREGRMVVYYVRIGHNIKIGTTTNFKYRMTSLQPDEILATEPGHEDVERARHKQFAHLRVPPGRERFQPAAELMEHIRGLRDRYGEPATAYPPGEGSPSDTANGAAPVGIHGADLL